jgi:kynurenine formamidase
MKFCSKAAIASIAICVCGSIPLTPPALGQTKDEGPWWPHAVWGPEDQAGASNWITPEKILKAISLVKTGKVYEMGHIYERGMPLLGQRSFAMFLVPGTPRADSGLVFNSEFLSAEIGQVGTQFDGFGHIGKRVQMEDGTVADVYYNGITFDDMRSRYGLLQLGVEKIKPYFTRGILVDVAGYKKLEILPNDYEVTMSDVRGAMAVQGLDENQIDPGDALFFNFGWGSLWNEPERILSNWRRRPLAAQDVLDWIVDRSPSVVGWDTGASGAAHAQLIMMNGIPNLEFMNYRELIDDGAFEFMFVFTPLRLKGATGSPGRPLAIR